MQLRPIDFTLFFTTVTLASTLSGCVESSDNSASGAGGTSGTGPTSTSATSGAGTGGTPTTGSGGAVGTTGTFSEGSGLNQCGVAAEPPADTGQCAKVSSPLIADFDDYAADSAEGYTYYVNGPPPAEGSVLGGILHVGDGSDTDGDSVIATEMVPGLGGEGYALHVSNDNAINWGGLLMFYFPSSPPLACLDASDYAGIEFSIHGSTPSGRFGVNLGMLDTIPTADDGLCDNPTADDCKDASLGVDLPDDAEAWTRIRVPWGAFTPGVGSDGLCAPDTGANLVRLVIQPFMNYAPPDYAFEPGPYSLTVDDVRFYGEADTSSVEVGGADDCQFPESIEWNASAPIIAPTSDEDHDLVAVKDPSIVRYDDRWHVFASSVSKQGAYNLVYTSFEDFSEASEAPLYYMDQTPGFDTYVAAPQVFYFTPQKKWYLVFQSGPPMYSTTDDISDPTTWTPPKPFYASTPAIVDENGGGWLDYWVICDSAWCHLFFSSNQGRYFNAKTSIDDFPNNFGEPVIVMQNSNSGRIFEGSNVYKMNGTNQYLAIIEAFDQTSNDHRYFRSWIADSLDGPWTPWQGSGSYPFAGERNVTFEDTAWTHDISHGEMVRASYDETLTIDPCDMRYMFQGADPMADSEGDYNKIPWHLGLLTQTQ